MKCLLARSVVLLGMWLLVVAGCGGGVVSTTRPEITGFTPTGGFLGQTVLVNFTGRNFQNGATLEVGPDPGITVGNVTVASATVMRANFTIAADATQSRRNIAVTNPNGERHTFEASFGVNGVSPVTVTAITPNTGARGGSFNVTITGTNFTAGAGVTSPAGSFTNLVVTSGTQITARLTIDGGTATGTHSVTVSDPNGFGNSLVNEFTVTQ